MTTQEVNTTDLQRLREADAEMLQMAVDYLKILPPCPATYDVIRSIERHLTEPQDKARLSQKLSGTMYSPLGYPLLVVQVNNGQAYVSLPSSSETSELIIKKLIQTLASDSIQVINLEYKSSNYEN